MKIDALTHPDAWRRSLCARVILLTIHELDLDKAAGAKLRQALEDAGVPSDTKRRINEGLRNVRQAQQKAQKQFAFLRNATIAHRDADAMLQYRSITQLDERKVLEVAVEFYEGAQLLISAIPEGMIAMTTIPSFLGNLAHAQRNSPRKTALRPFEVEKLGKAVPRIVLDVENHIRCAEAFLEAYKRCDPENEIENPSKMGVPAIVCGAFASEVALKALILLLRNEAATGHDLYKLFAKLPGHLRVQIQEGTRLSVEKFDGYLQKAKLAFSQWRYFYEDKEALIVNVNRSDFPGGSIL